jgi:hypothetical protein
MQGQWLGTWDGEWLGAVGDSGNPVVFAGLKVSGTGAAQLGAILIDGEKPASYSAEVELSRKWYVKRKKQILVFDTAQQADAFIDAEQIAEQAIEQAQRTSRRARKRLRERVFKVEGVLPADTVDIDLLGALVDRYQMPVNLPQLIAQQDFERVMQIMALALEMQDEDDVEMLLLM